MGVTAIVGVSCALGGALIGIGGVEYYHHKKKIHHSSHKEKRRLEKSEDLNKNQIFMTKISELYNDNEYNLKILNKKYNRTLKRIEPFLIKKFKSNQWKYYSFCSFM